MEGKIRPVHDDEWKEIIQSVPRQRGWSTTDLYQYQGFWYEFQVIQEIVSFQNHFAAQNSDVKLVSTPKSGTVWLKALTFSILNRNRFTKDSHPLLTSNPHTLIPFLEFQLYAKCQVPDLSKLEGSPRLFSTHTPYSSLPESIKDSDCKIVYICRNPKDVCVSLWHFMNKSRDKGITPLAFEEAFQLFCKGVSDFGPFWDHVLAYWKISRERPDKVLFLKYEDLKLDTRFHMEKVAGFLGHPFTSEEVEQGVVDDIISLCSFVNLSNLEVNKTGKFMPEARGTNDRFFRKGKVGDWMSHLTEEMASKIDRITEDKLNRSGLIL